MLRRAVGGYERLVRRFTAQTTDYQVLLSTFAEGLYTELDFRNEALNNLRMRELIDASEFAYGDKIVIPVPLLNLTSRCVSVVSRRFLSPHAHKVRRMCLFVTICAVANRTPFSALQFRQIHAQAGAHHAVDRGRQAHHAGPRGDQGPR